MVVMYFLKRRQNMKILKTNETGRSMVEMLGVLAIIGVLSVAGISGYTAAMRSHRTNEVVNAASMLYISAMTQNAGNGPDADVEYSSLENESLPSVSDFRYDSSAKNITVTFNDDKDCEMAKNKLGDNKASGTCPTLTITFEGSSTSAPEEP